MQGRSWFFWLGGGSRFQKSGDGSLGEGLRAKPEKQGLTFRFMKRRKAPFDKACCLYTTYISGIWVHLQSLLDGERYDHSWYSSSFDKRYCLYTTYISGIWVHLQSLLDGERYDH